MEGVFNLQTLNLKKLALNHLNVLVLLLLRVNVFVHPSVSFGGQAVFGIFLLTNCLIDCHLSLLVIRPWVNSGWQLAASLLFKVPPGARGLLVTLFGRWLDNNCHLLVIWSAFLKIELASPLWLCSLKVVLSAYLGKVALSLGMWFVPVTFIKI